MKFLITLILFVTIISSAYAKDCDSELPGHLIPFNDSFSGNAEIVLGFYLNDYYGSLNDYYKPMINSAFNYSIYVNTGLKFKIPDGSEGNGSGKGSGIGSVAKFSMRDFFYENINTDRSIKTGFLTTSLNEHLLLDERGFGLDYRQKFGLITPRLFASSVLYEFQKEGRGCISKELNVAHDYYKKNPEAFSQYFGGINIEIGGSSSSISNQQVESDDEFSEFTETTNAVPFKIDSTYYIEAYDFGNDYKQFIGLHNSYSIIIIDYSIESALQLYNEDVSIGYTAKLYRTIFTKTVGSIKPYSGYTSYNIIVGDEQFRPYFSNMYLSDRMQYLANDKNVLYAGIEYRPIKKIILDAAEYYKIAGEQSMEFDFGLTYYYWEHSKIKIGYNLINSGDKNIGLYHQAYTEIRHLF